MGWWMRCRRATRAFLGLVVLGVSRLAAAFQMLPAPLLGLGGGAVAITGMLLLGGSPFSYLLTHDAKGRPEVDFPTQDASGAQGTVKVDVGGSDGEAVAGLAPMEGLPAGDSSRPLAGVSQPVPFSSAAGSAPASAGSAADAFSTVPGMPYEQALALSTMVRVDDRPDDMVGWPVVNYCRSGVHALQCQHNDLWLRNTSSIELTRVRVCLKSTDTPFFRLAGAGPDGCRHLTIPGGADRHLDIVEAQPAQAGYPGFSDLVIDLSQNAWQGGVTLARLRVPVSAPQTFFPLNQASAPDWDHSVTVQERKVDLLTRLVVFTYHGSGDSAARIQAVSLKDPQGGLRILPRSSHDPVFKHYDVSECTASPDAQDGQVHDMGSGVSCALLVSATDIHKPPFVPQAAAATAPASGAQAASAATAHTVAASTPAPVRSEAQAFKSTRIQGQLEVSFLVGDADHPTHAVDKALPVGLSQEVIAGGNFNAVGTEKNFQQPAPHLVAVDAQGFVVPPGLILGEDDRVSAIGVSPRGRHLYIGGVFHPENMQGARPVQSFLAVSEGSRWAFANARNGPNGEVLAIARDGAQLYVGGRFKRVAGADSPAISALTPAQPGQQPFTAGAWQNLGGLSVTTHDANAYPGVVRSLVAAPNGDLYMGGTFGFGADRADPTTLPYGPQVNYANVVRWSPTSHSWGSLGLVLGGKGMGMYQVHVDALALHGPSLSVGGEFQYAGEASSGLDKLGAAEGWASFRADRDPQWAAVAASVDSRVRSFVRTPQGLYAGGSFILSNFMGRRLLLLQSAGKIHGLDKELALSPSQATGIVSTSVDALAAIGDTVFMGGSFAMLSNQVRASNLACYLGDSGQPAPLAGGGVDGKVRALKTIWAMRIGQH